MLVITATVSAEDSGHFSVGCLTNDSALKAEEGLGRLDAAATLTISPALLWPVNQRFSNTRIAMSLPATVQLSSAVTVTLTVNNVTNDQVVDDDPRRSGCRAAIGNLGTDWTPATLVGLSASGRLQATTDTVSVTAVQLRRERCLKLGARTYRISVTCCDITHAVCDSIPQVLNVLVPKAAVAGLHHYEYVLPAGHLYVYDTDDQFSAVKHFSLPTGAGVRGAVASAATGRLYVSYGSDNTTGGSMLAYDLMDDKVLWTRKYSFGIDSMSISPDGSRIYMPTGELTSGGIWSILGLRSGGIW